MKILRFTGLLFSSLFLLMSCATTSTVMTDYDREADFSQYRTFFWTDEFQLQNGGAGENEPLFYNTLNKKRLKQAIQREMEGRGYVLTSDDPDLLVNAHVVVEERNTNPTYYPFHRGLYYWGNYNTAMPQQADKEGDIIIDLIDQNQHQLVWQGYAAGVLDTRTERREEEIREAVTLIFAEYGRRAGGTTPTEQ